MLLEDRKAGGNSGDDGNSFGDGGGNDVSLALAMIVMEATSMEMTPAAPVTPGMLSPAITGLTGRSATTTAHLPE